MSATGIDELNIINPDTDSGSGGSGGGADGGYSADEFDMGELDTSAMDEMDSKYQGLIDRAKELKGSVYSWLLGWFWGYYPYLIAFRHPSSSIKDSLDGDIHISGGAGSCQFGLPVSAGLLVWGKVAGSVASIGASIADNLLGGISLFLQQNKDRIKEYLVSMFDIGSRIAEIER
ncbi:MAG: hypothetical protein ACLTW9_17130 [Enterocloster sp.]